MAKGVKWSEEKGRDGRKGRETTRSRWSGRQVESWVPAFASARALGWVGSLRFAVWFGLVGLGCAY